MAGKTLMYVHGFASSAASGTVRTLRELLPETRVVAEDIPLHPEEGLAMLRDMTDRERPDLIVGTSMGGMYAEQLKGFDRILVNPAFQMGETMSKHGLTGKQVFQNLRKDGVQEFMVTKGLVKEYEQVCAGCFRDITPEEQARVTGLFGDKDPLVHTYDLFRSHYPAAIRFHGEHRLNDTVALHYLLPVIRRIDDRQEGRERQIVFLSLETLHDAYGHPASSMHKTYEYLLEKYRVYIVAPSDSADPQAMVSAAAWTEEALSAPAWNQLIFIRRRELLYGDFLITRRPCPDFMGTVLHFGSDDFKTWDDVATFFSRLG